MSHKLKALDLFSGIGGFALGLENTGGFETTAFCEIDPFCKKVLNKHWPEVQIYDDIKQLTAARLAEDGHGQIDIITGGFPCQPFSVAGRKQGINDDRDLWPEMFRLIQETRPTWVIGENVAHFIKMAFTRTVSDLEGEGYSVQAFIIPACAVGAPHRRDRVFIIAHLNSERLCARRDYRERGSLLSHSKRNTEKNQQKGQQWQLGFNAIFENITDLNSLSLQRHMQEPLSRQRALQGRNADGSDPHSRERPALPEPLLGRELYGLSNGVDRIKALGNAVVPQIPEMIGEAILEVEKKYAH